MLAGNILTSCFFITYPIFLSIWLIDLPALIGDLFHTQTHPPRKNNEPFFYHKRLYASITELKLSMLFINLHFTLFHESFKSFQASVIPAKQQHREQIHQDKLDHSQHLLYNAMTSRIFSPAPFLDIHQRLPHHSE